MIYYLLLISLPLVGCCQSISQKQYMLKEKEPNVILFSAITSLIALFFFLLTSRFDLVFDGRLVPYSLGFAVSYSAAWIGSVFAVRYGNMAISSLITSCSLIFPTTYGIIMGETITPQIIVGVVLLFTAIVLVNLKLDPNDKFSVKWFVFAMISFLGNGACSIMQNMQKRLLGDSFTHEFMIIALSVAFVLLLVFSCATSKNIRADFKVCLPFATTNGMANGAVNFLMLTLIGNIPNTILYPSMSALNMIAAFLLSYVVYKEKFSRLQYVGYVLGVVSIVLLNLKL
ncbi:MAG: DMT family transporter [Clostridia bacterium]|nr:DMT family transporter [Clostridia bacterium]